MVDINQKIDRTWRIDGVVEILAAALNKKYIFVQGLTTVWDSGSYARDSIGDGEAVFTQNGDVIGTFSFQLKNTVDLYQLDSGVENDSFLSNWLKNHAEQDPTEVQFTQTFTARKQTVDPQSRIVFTGRIMKPEMSQLVDVAIDDVVIDGEILALLNAERLDV